MDYKEGNVGPINYQPLKDLASPDAIEPPKHLRSLARIRMRIPAQLHAVDKLLDP